MTNEEKRALKAMDRFANSEDLSCVTAKEMRIILNLIENLQKENEELRENNKKLYEIGQEMCKQDKYTSENYIPIQKIKDNIEELNKEIKNCDTIDAIFKIKQQQILQELLDGSDTDVGSIESED